VRSGRAADHSPPSSAAVMEQQSYTSAHPLGHTGPVTGSLYLLQLTIPKLCVQLCAPDDGRRNRLKYVQRFRNKYIKIVAYCWL